jgi:hypothetical protein
MLGWRMEEEAKLEFTITVNWRREDGSIATTQLATLARGACRSAVDVGLQLADAKPILGRLQEIVVSEQLQRYCEAVRTCPGCHRRRHLKDHRRRCFHTVFGRLVVDAPRFDGCRHCGERRSTSPVSELLPERVSPELRHLQAKLAAQLPYRQAAALLDELLPLTGGLNRATTRNRTLAVGKRIEEEIREEIDHPCVLPEPAKQMVVGIDGAFVKAGHTRPGQRHQFEILTGRVEAPQRGGEAFAVVRDLDPYAKRRVQAILRRCGRGQDTDLRILSDGEDGLRGVVGTWFGKKCQHRLDWFHVARRIARIEKEFLYLPYGDDFQERLAAHWANLNSMKWMLWNDGVDMAEFGMTRVRISLFQHAMAHPEANSERFESIEAKLDELRSYLYANRESVRGYAEAYRNGERISTAHVECTVNQLINWRMCKKRQMGWSRAGAQYLLHVKTAIINGRLDRYTGHHSAPADVAA